MAEQTASNTQKGLRPASEKRISKAPKKTGRIYRLVGEVDRPLLIVIIALLCIGSIMVFSASYASADARYGDSYYFARRQVRWLLFGVVGMAVMSKTMDYRILKRFAYIAYVAALGLNYLVPFFGETSGGATRWYVILGVQFQPSEVLKFCLILALATYISNHSNEMKNFKNGVLNLGLITAPAALATLLQSHLSATIIIILIMVVMIWLSGTKSFYIGAVAGIIATAGVALLTIGRGIIETFVPQALTRLEVWNDPFSYMSAASGGKGWQPAQSLYAISSGGFWGLGLGQSNLKHGYLPEPQNDYIFAILCEEMGFFGAFAVIVLFCVFAYRGFHIARNAPSKFSSLVAMGITMQVVIQVILNLAVVTNTIPSTGISLPFFSYGGTSLLLLLAEMGILLSISRYSFIEQG